MALEAAGNKLPKEAVPDFTYTIGADGKATGKMPKSEYTATMTVNPKKDPKTIDNMHESGPYKRKGLYGIYKLEGDSLTVCVSPPGAVEGGRPKGFTTRDTANVLFVVERVKEDKKR